MKKTTVELSAGDKFVATPDGCYKLSKRIFQSGRYEITYTFLALAHYDAGQRDLVIRQLGDALLNESTQPRLTRYRRVLARKFHALRG